MLVTAPPAPVVPEQLRGQPAVILSAAWFGPAGQAESVVRGPRELFRFNQNIRPQPQNLSQPA
jgi:hypothetical protein